MENVTVTANVSCIPQWYSTLELASAVTSLAANAILFVLIIFRTPDELKVYTKVLLCNCVIDVFYTAVAYFIELHMYFMNGVVFYTVKNNGFNTTLHGRFMATVVYWFATYMTVYAITIPFLYRYFAVCRNYIMSKKALFGLVAFEAILESLALVPLYLFWWPSVETTSSAITSDMHSCVDPGVVPHYSMEEALSLRISGVLVLHFILVGLHYVLILTCSYAIWRKIKSSSGLSHRTSAIQAQLSHVLRLQALTPFFVAVLPITGCIVCLMFSLSWLGRLVELATNVISWIPIMNPLFTIVFIKSYRRALLKVCRGFHTRIFTHSPSRTSTSVSVMT